MIEVSDTDRQITVIDHLAEIRKRLVLSVAALLIGTVAGYVFVPAVTERLIDIAGSVVFLSPAEAFVSRIRFSFMLGLAVALPFVLFQVWAFVSPAVGPSQRRKVRFILPITYLLFAAGVLFAYYAVVPAALRFLVGFSDERVEPLIGIGNLISFSIGLMFPFGLAFELPVAVYILSRAGLVSATALARNRKIAILVIFVIAAVITPTPDVFTQAMMALPLMLLYEVSILIARLNSKARRAQRQAGDSSPR